MNVVNKLVINATSAADLYSEAIDGSQLYGISAIGVFADGAAAGTLSFQGSNDVTPSGVLSPPAPTNWVVLPDSSASATVASGATTAIQAKQNSFRWYRVHWAKSGGAGNVSVYFFAQGF